MDRTMSSFAADFAFGGVPAASSCGDGRRYAFGGWGRAQKTHFADGGLFDQIQVK